MPVNYQVPLYRLAKMMIAVQGPVELEYRLVFPWVISRVLRLLPAARTKPDLSLAKVHSSPDIPALL